jgi:hypothetical protein
MYLCVVRNIEIKSNHVQISCCYTIHEKNKTLLCPSNWTRRPGVAGAGSLAGRLHWARQLG